MKRNRLLALALAVCLCAALAVPAAAAETTYTDLPADYWATPHILSMTEAGMFTGYGDGTFRPENTMQAVEALALCARVTQPLATRNQIAADQAALLREIFPTMPENWWFHKEAATCLVLGVIDADTLSDLNTSGALNQPMSKADFAMYLVRAMGLDDLARTLDPDGLPFNDEASIADHYRPYVKLLYNYGILTGDNFGNFNPDQPMSRAICATMLSRSIEHIVEERKISVELPQYTKYAWTSGTVVDVDVDGENRILTLQSEITGQETVILPPTTKVYQYNKEDQFTALKTGAFAKVCYAADGKTVEAVRVTPAALIDEVAGDCDGVSTNQVVIDGSPFTIDRFTQVSAGGRTGDRSIIDYEANYTDAQAAVNSQGTVLWLKLSGGTRLLEGILTDVTIETVGLTQRTTITVTGYNGTATSYTVPATADVIVNGDLSTLKESQEGRQITLRVADGDLSSIQSVEVNMNDRYIQGILRTVNTKSTPNNVEITVSGESKKTRYELSGDCAVTYRGTASELSKLALNSFVTAKVEGGTLTTLMAWQGYEDTEGTLTALTYGDPTILEVTRSDGTAIRFSIPVDRLGSISFTSGNKDGDITQLRTGDHVVVTVLYNDVSQVDYTAQAANVSGTLSTLTRNADGTSTLTLTFADGSTHTYTASAATTVVQDGKPASLSAVNPGSQVSLVAKGSRAVSIEITGSATRRDNLRGTIYTKNDQARTVTILVTENGQTVPKTVHIASGVTILDVTTGSTLRSVSSLSEGETIQVWGSYATNGTFEATSVVRE